MILRNSAYNMLGLGLPLLVAVVAIPALIHGLGEARFGALTLIWAIVSYFGLFDLGLGRVVTQQVAVAVAEGRRAELPAILGTSSALMLALGLVGAAIMLLGAPFLSARLAQGPAVGELQLSFAWMALAMPAIVLTSGYRGVLEALGRFGLVNAIRVPMGVFTFAGPLAVLWLGYDRLDVISAVLALGRIVACVVHGWAALASLPEVAGHGRFERSRIVPTLSYGGWLTVSNVVSPLMNYTDRFLLGLTVSAAAVAHYATPQELILRIGIIPGAISAVLFPMFAAGGDNAGKGHMLRYSLLIALIMAPITLVLVLFAHPILALWIGPDFADKAAAVLQIVAIAALASGVAQVPFTMLQGQGRADLTAKVHLIEFPLYLATLYILVLQFGAIGAAWAWLVRITIDMLVLFWLSWRNAPYRAPTEVKTA